MKRKSFPAQRSLFVAAIVVCAASLPLDAAENLKTSSRMPHHHVIPIRDADGNIIAPPPAFDEQGKPQEARGNAYSTAQTCGRCHEYEVIRNGWHFNAGKGNVPSGRPGEPWILTDPATRTQILLSFRGWEGTFKPGDLGISDFEFITEFARHYPGGGVGEPETLDLEHPKNRRFAVTGKMEIDCMMCHNQHGHYDHDARMRALSGENFQWLPAISAGLGAFGSPRTAKVFADRWRPGTAAPTNIPPMKYDRAKFDVEHHVTFDVTRKASSACYYCHTSQTHLGDSRWHSDQDVHLRAGMKCTDCHRNGIDHMIVRGYEGEIKERTITADMVDLRSKIVRRNDAEISEAEASKVAERQLTAELGRVETLSCRGCHMGSENGGNDPTRLAGRLGAPYPLHKGMPPIHFEKLSCTACHAGPFPTDATQIVQTSLAHKLGLMAPVRGENTAPVIVQPVFLPGQDGRIAPHRAVWPSYWGRLKDGKVQPILPEEVSKLAQAKLPRQASDDVPRDPYNTKPLTDQQIQEVLTALSADPAQGEAVFIASGKLYQLEGESVKSAEHEAAKAYTWALGHDVRPAGQSLGARGCADCHAGDSPIYFSEVTARGPVSRLSGVSRDMLDLRGEDRTLVSLFAFTFNFRPMLKVICFGSAFIILGVLLSHLVSGLNAVTRGPRSNEREDR
jgi:hypothetical protein